MRLSYPDNGAGIVPVGSKDQQTGIYSFKLGLPYRPLHLCHLLTSRLVVYDDGQVSACPGRDSENVMNIGDIKTEGFLEMRSASFCYPCCFNLTSFDHLVGKPQQCRRDREVQGLCRLEINDHFEFSGLNDRQIRRGA